MYYPLTLTKDDDGSFLVTCELLPEVTSFGDTVQEAELYGSKAVQEAIAARMYAFQDIPRPAPRSSDAYAKVPLAMALKLELYWALGEVGKTRADLVRLTGWSRTKVDRLFDPNHESKLTQMEEAFAALHKNVQVELAAA